MSSMCSAPRLILTSGLHVRAMRLRPGIEWVVPGKALLQLAGGAQLAGDQALSADLAHRALRIAEQHNDEALQLIALARLALNPASPASATATAIYEWSLRSDNHYAAYLAANAAALRAAIARHSVTGLLWSDDRIIALHRRHDNGHAPVVLECEATY